MVAQERIAVVGLGYVGIPLCALLADKGFDVVGIDVSQERVEAVKRGFTVLGELLHHRLESIFHLYIAHPVALGVVEPFQSPD